MARRSTAVMVLVVAMAAQMGGAKGGFWQSFGDDTTDGAANPARCREGQVITSLRCTGRYCDDIFLQCANVDVDRTAPKVWTFWFSEETNNPACPEQHLASGIECSGRYCDNMRLECTRMRLPFSYTDRFWSPEISEETSPPYEPGANEFVMGAKCIDSYCDRIQLRYTNSSFAKITELTVADVKQQVRANSTVLDLPSQVAYVVATAADGRVLLGTKLPSAQNTSFRGSSWQWLQVPDAPSADYRLYTFQTPLPSGSTFLLEAPRDPTTNPPLFSIVALATAGSIRLTCVNIQEVVTTRPAVQPNPPNLQSVSSGSPPPPPPLGGMVQASLYCLPYSILPPRTILISEPTDRVDVTALVASGTVNSLCSSLTFGASLATRDEWASRGVIDRGCNNTGPWFALRPGPVSPLRLHGAPAPWLSMPSDFNMADVYNVVALQLKNQMMEQFNKLGFPIIRAEFDMFLHMSFTQCTTLCHLSSSRAKPRTLLTWDFVGTHTIAKANSDAAQRDACTQDGWDSVHETLRLTFDLEVRNQELAETLADAYARVVAASSLCYMRTNTMSGFQGNELFCDISIPYSLGLSIWELGGEQATMKAIARKSNCADVLPKSSATCPAWVGILSSLVGMMLVPVTGGASAAVTAAAAAAPTVASGIIGTTCAALDTAAA